ncbi:MAG: tRNA pseudouridine synthase B [Candidatus Omnitrophica bacterium]|nr:tRNA pseudouridine synthase B [Candidatus Omnitrophota bacterium]
MDGALLLDKPILWTSHDAVDHLRRRTGLRRIGHAGTLDPMATGLLVMLLGKATKRSDEFMGLDKTYEGILTLGVRTDTLDLEGRVSSQSPVDVTIDRVRSAASSLRGALEQRPPAYSALKIKGRKSCDLARKGQEVLPEPRKVTVHEFEIIGYREPDVAFRIVCSKGTYVRSLAAELGERLGCGAVLSALKRRRIGPYDLSQAVTVESLATDAGPTLAGRLF